MNQPTPLCPPLDDQVRQLLSGVSTATLTKLLKNGIIPFYPDPLDERVKLVSRAEVLRLKVRERKAAA